MSDGLSDDDSREAIFRVWLKTQIHRKDAIGYLARDADDVPWTCGTMELWLEWAMDNMSPSVYRPIVDAWWECFPYYPSMHGHR